MLKLNFLPHWFVSFPHKLLVNFFIEEGESDTEKQEDNEAETKNEDETGK